MKWKLPRPIKPLEQPLPQHTGLFWTIGKILTPLAPFAAVLLLSIPSAFVFWLLINMDPGIHGAGLAPRLRVVNPEDIKGSQWFVNALAAQILLGFVAPRVFLLLQALFWSGAIFYLKLFTLYRIH